MLISSSWRHPSHRDATSVRPDRVRMGCANHGFHYACHIDCSIFRHPSTEQLEKTKGAVSKVTLDQGPYLRILRAW